MTPFSDAFCDELRSWLAKRAGNALANALDKCDIRSASVMMVRVIGRHRNPTIGSTIRIGGTAMAYARPSTVERAVVNQLRRMILQGDLKPGSTISFDELAKTFDVSRVPIRDALRILEGEALVVAQPHKGYQVARLDVSELLEIQGIRQILETDAIKRAVPHLNEEVATEMAELLDQMTAVEDAGDMAGWVDVHRRFHFVLFDQSGSSIESRALHTLWNASDLYRSEYLHSEAGRRTSAAQHRALVEAVQTGDVAAIIRVMDAHRGSTIAALTERLPSTSP